MLGLPGTAFILRGGRLARHRQPCTRLLHPSLDHLPLPPSLKQRVRICLISLGVTASPRQRLPECKHSNGRARIVVHSACEDIHSATRSHAPASAAMRTRGAAPLPAPAKGPGGQLLLKPDQSAGGRLSLRVASLFSGCGGLDLGLHLAGHRLVLLCDSSPFCQAILGVRFPGTLIAPSVEGLEKLPPCDLVACGPPCSDVSIAGNRLGLDGPRTGLWQHVIR